MSDKSGIQWTDATWNPVIGCRRVSEGCRNCYAEVQARRIAAMHPNGPYPGVVRKDYQEKPLPLWNGTATFLPERLDQPLRWRKPRLVFVNSMSDLFHEDVTNEQIAAVFGVMAAARQHTFQVLTKRSKRMREWFAWAAAIFLSGQALPTSEVYARVGERFGDGFGSNHWPLSNVWIGVSAEDQQRADERIPDLLACPAAVHWVSAEPLLGPIDFLGHDDGEQPEYPGKYLGQIGGMGAWTGFGARLDWIVVGGESGPGTRGCDLAWIEDIVEQCSIAAVPVFVKQLGSRPYRESPPRAVRSETSTVVLVPIPLRHSDKGGDPRDWPDGLGPREWPEARS